MTTVKWDKIMAEQRKDIASGQEMMVRALIKEIRDYGYTSIAQVNGALSSHLDRLKGESNE